MTLKYIRFCNECDCIIPNDADFIGIEGIYIDGQDRGNGVDIVKGEDFCSPDCLFGYVRAKWQQDQLKPKPAEDE